MKAECHLFLAAKSRYFDRYDFSSLPKEKDILYVAIQSDELYHPFFDECYTCTAKSQFREPISTFDFQELLKLVSEINQLVRISRIICIEEGNLSVAAALRQILNIEGQKEKDVDFFTSKLKMYERLSRQNFPVPKFRSLDTGSPEEFLSQKSYDDLSTELGKPFVIKPASSSGSFGVQIVSSVYDFLSVEILEGFQYLASEYIEGDLYHCDYQVYRGKVVFFGINKYLNPPLDFIKGSNHGTISIHSGNDAYQQLNNLCTEIISMLELQNGTYHFEVFIRRGRPVFLEAAARPPGGFIIDAYKNNFGFNIVNSDYTIQIGNEPTFSVDDRSPCFIIAIPKKRGTLNAFSLPKIATRHQYEWFVELGDKMEQPASLIDKAGHLYVWHSDYAELFKIYRQLRGHEFYTVSD